MPDPVKAVVFDLDCTLVDTLDRFYELFNELLEKYGRKGLKWEEFFEYYVEDTLDDVIAPKSTPQREELLHRFWMDFLWKYREGEPHWKLLPGVKDVMEKISRDGISIAVITSCIVPGEKLKKELEGLGIGGFVKAVATAHDVVEKLESGHHFSKLEIFGLAFRRLGVRPEDSIIVGDYWNDIRDGKRLGARVVAVLTGHMRKELLKKYGPDAIIEGVKDLPRVLREV